MLKEFYLINKNKKLFNYKSNNDGIILIEYNLYCSSHLCQALIANFIKKKTSNKIIAYYNYSLIVSPLKLKFITKIKWAITNLLGLKFKSIYRSFGVQKFIRPNISKEISKKAEKISKKYFQKKRTQNDILNFGIDKIWIGDLLYDTFLKSKIKPSIDTNSDEFKSFFKEFVELFFYWKEYLDNNNITNIIGVHTCYSFGLLIRIGINRNVPCFVTNTRDIFKINKKIPTMYGDYTVAKKLVNNLPNYIKKKGIIQAKKRIKERLSGKLVNDLFLTNISAFKKLSKLKRVLNKNSKIKILICTHDYFDAVHLHGKHFFTDFHTWLEYLGKLSEKKKFEYDFYLKNHPNFGNKYDRYRDITEVHLKDFLKRYKNIKQIPNNTSHHQIISEGINFVLTVHGTVAMEYAYLDIPVINATLNNPHINYNFSINPLSLSDYKNKLNNLKKIKLNAKKKEIEEFYFTRYIYPDNNWLFLNYDKFLKSVNGYENIHSKLFYNYWLKNFSKKDKKRIFKSLDNFFNSNDPRISIRNTGKYKKLK